MSATAKRSAQTGLERAKIIIDVMRKTLKKSFHSARLLVRKIYILAQEKVVLFISFINGKKL